MPCCKLDHKHLQSRRFAPRHPTGRIGRAICGRIEFSRFGLELKGFLRRSGAGEAGRTARTRQSQGHPHSGDTIAQLGGSTDQDILNCLNRHKFTTGSPAFSSTARRRNAIERRSGGHASGAVTAKCPWESRQLQSAEELSKGWRFFPTYAAVQTSTVLRHSFSHTRDHECQIRRLPRCTRVARRCSRRSA